MALPRPIPTELADRYSDATVLALCGGFRHRHDELDAILGDGGEVPS